MRYKIFFILVFIIPILGTTIRATNANTNANYEVVKENIKNLQFVYLPDERFPTYEIVFYFADGALSDRKYNYGETSSLFSLLTAGTDKYKQEEINDFLEFYGVGIGGDVTHEYSYFSVFGLDKDIEPTLKMICHLFSKSNFPDDELKKFKIRGKTTIENIIASPSALGDRIFRELSLQDTPYQKSADISLDGIKNLNRKSLNEKLKYFNKNVKKRVYVSAPKVAYLKAQKIISKECGFDLKKSTFIRKADFTANSNSNQIRKYQLYLVPIANSTQAQIRIGRYIYKREIADIDLMQVGSEFLGGGGFGSRLMQELRVDRGLTYGVSAFASPQRDYGRSAITTSTKNESVNEAIEVIKNVLAKTSEGQYEEKDLKKTIKLLAGKHPFNFEKRDSYLRQLMYSDHIGQNYKAIYDFPNIISKYSKQDVSLEIKKLFPWEQQTIVVVGSASLEAELKKKWGKVTILDYKNFL
ncbi:MAG: insulinase family protein [Oligoflexia bacterium]|nr:insulinase family protein [Oligoflexia bacterium]